MLNLLDASLESFLRSIVPLPSRDVDVSFEAPDKEWGTGITKPTINLYLWDIRRHVTGTESGMQIIEQDDGTKVRRPPKPRVDCRYFISAWTAEVRDEHALLGGVLAALLPLDQIPPEHLEGAYAGVRPLPALQVCSPGENDKSDFWSALGGQLKPGLDLLVTATMDAFLAAEAGPPVERYRVSIEGGGAASEFGVVGGTGAADGARVTGPRGSSTVASDGTFAVRSEPGDEITIHADPIETRPVPESGLTSAVATKKRRARKKSSQ